MKPISDKLFLTMTRLDGLKFKGFITTPFGFKEEDMYHRVLNVRKPALVGLGDVVNGPGNSKILLMEYPNEDEWYVNFRAAYVNAEYTWERTVKSLDPVARVMRDFQNVPMGTIHAYLDKPRDVKTGTMLDTRYSFYTGEEVIEGDLIGGKIVKKVVESMGVKLIHVE